MMFGKILVLTSCVLYTYRNLCAFELIFQLANFYSGSSPTPPFLNVLICLHLNISILRVFVKNFVFLSVDKEKLVQ